MALCLRENDPAIDADVEDTAAAGDQLGLVTAGLGDFRRHTDGVRLEVSHAAVLEGDFHGMAW